MHLLSAILQEATGLTALEFARRNLFEPLGIQDVVWEADPQGYTYGWSNLRLKPGDAAKIGYLFLLQGVWDGAQVVPADWVKEAVKPLTKTGNDEDYGYGWWVSKGSFKAIGRGGQRIVVIPSLALIVVTTGGGFEFNTIEPFLFAAIGDTEKPLVANPEAVIRLKTTLAALARAPEPQPIGPLPDSAHAISGKVFMFKPNSVRMETLSLEFSESAEAILRFSNQGSREITTWPIGLDGVYRHSPDGQAHRGRWIGSQTFVFDSIDIETRSYRLYFEGDSVVLESPELGLRMVGKQGNP